jgi:hypothetical protein
LGRGFVKFAAHAALLFIANGQQLVREPAEIRLGPGMKSDVTGGAYEADNFPGGVRDGGGEPLQKTDGAVRQGIGLGETESGTGPDGRFEVPAEFFGIFEFQNSPDVLEMRRELGRVDAVKFKELFGPAHLAAVQIELPGTDLGGFFGMLQQYFGVAQTFGQRSARGDVR